MSIEPEKIGKRTDRASGTPDPEKIGTSYSHGCVRMTNWDALTVAGLVKPGTPVVFEP